MMVVNNKVVKYTATCCLTGRKISIVMLRGDSRVKGNNSSEGKNNMERSKHSPERLPLTVCTIRRV